MPGFPARCCALLSSLGRNHHKATVSHPALGDDVVGEMLYLGAASFQLRHLHAIVIVEVNVKCRHRQIVMSVIVLHQTSR